MKAQEAVRHAPVELPVDATIGEAAKLMDDCAVGAVVVVDQRAGGLWASSPTATWWCERWRATFLQTLGWTRS